MAVTRHYKFIAAIINQAICKSYIILNSEKPWKTFFHSPSRVSAEILGCAGIKQGVIAELEKYHGKFMSPYSIGGVYKWIHIRF